MTRCTLILIIRFTRSIARLGLSLHGKLCGWMTLVTVVVYAANLVVCKRIVDSHHSLN